MSKPLTVYKASAGSGKTFTLATNYIKLVVENPLSYRNILAVTFTNKATEEMKMRILSQLYGIWKQLPDSANYMRAICEKTGLSEALVSERAGIALSNLLHNYNYFRVETIDTFFQGVLRNLARELDLTANLRIGLNDSQVEELAVDKLIEDLNTTDVILQWLLRYIMENISDDKSWNVIGQIKTFGKTIFHDEYKNVSNMLRQKMEEPGFFDNYTTRLKELRAAAEERMKGLAHDFFETIDSEGLSIDDFSYGKSGVCSIFLKLQEGLFDESIVSKRVTESVGDSGKWCKKNHPRREQIQSLVDTSLDNILRTVIEERPRQWKRYKTAELTLRHLNQLRLLGCIEKTVRELNESANRFLLCDTQQLLHALIDGSDTPFIFEKIGTQLQHIMIDEFQDTSTVQWQNFKVLLSEAMSQEGSESLIVGDVKQSIYRWRSGDWRLLNDIQTQFPSSEAQLDIRTLDTNYRSQRNIIEFNNAFFRSAAQLEYLALQDNPEATALQRAYADVKQTVPDKLGNNGMINIQLLPPDDYQEKTFARIADIVCELTEKGVKPSRMAILVRANAYIPQIADYFTKQLPDIRIVSDEAFRLDASIAVNLLVGSLHLITHPDDILAKANVAKFYQRYVLGTKMPDNELLLSTNPLNELLPEAYINHFEELTNLSLYELTERLYTIFELHRLEGQSAYLCAFYDQLLNFTSENATGIDAFVSEWEENLCSKTIQSDEINGIRLISIHKSKGLEFDHVIIPFCDWQLEKSQGNILWCRPDEAPFNDLPIVPIDYSPKQMRGTIYEDDYQHEHLQNTVDNLNLLYVAFTRAVQSLFVIGKRNAKNSRSMLIEQVLPLIVQEIPDANLSGIDNESDPVEFTCGTLVLEEDAPHKESTNPFLQEAETVSFKIKTFDNPVSFRQSNRSKDFISAQDDDNEEQQQRQYIQTGSILHLIFSTIRTSADIDSALKRLQLEGILYDEEVTAEKISSMLRKRLQNARVADWFSDRWTLFNECTILSVENGEVIERRPDRVMTNGKEWVVVDFKFGSPKDEYHNQVREYMQLLVNMGHTNIKGYLWFVYSNIIEEVILNQL
ncbi:MAG: UvrD-helicase domain-containing protein [Prevotella sp.]|nr:UvrD-helicase domain-containing protein [Prevotella sp.]